MSFIHALNTVLTLRLDAVAFAVLAFCAAAGCHLWIRWRRPTEKLPPTAWLLVGVATIAAAFGAEWAGNQRKQQLVSVFSALGPTYAYELQQLDHASITLDTSARDPIYLRLIAAEKAWLAATPLVADIYTFRVDGQGRVRLLVDSETDYDHNGRYESEREQRTEIGEIFSEATDNFRQTLRDTATFDTNFVPDRWGIWVTSLTPIYNREGKVEAGLGIDYPADNWLFSITWARLIALGTTAVLLTVLLSSTTLVVLMRAEIRERQAAEAELKRAKDSADAANRAKGEFLAVMSHEIRTPLTAVLGFSSVLEDTALDETQHGYVTAITSAGKRLASLLDDVLDLAKIEEGKLVLDLAPFSPRELIEECANLMSAKAAEKKLHLRTEFPPEPHLQIIGDATRIRQVVLNLIGNALKFTESGTIHIRSQWTPSGQSPTLGILSISVRDPGIGIPADKLPLLFEKFSQADASTSRHFGGTGLGLAICRNLVRLMGGHISAQSEPGRGSEFTFELPTQRAETPRVGRAPADDVAVIEGAPEILIVDDQPTNRELLDVMLRKAGYRPHLAHDAAEAVKLATQRAYAAVLMDLQMPGVDGYMATARIRAAEPKGRRVPIIAISATTIKGTRERCLAAGMDDYLVKPIDTTALHRTLAAITQRGGPRRPSSINA